MKKIIGCLLCIGLLSVSAIRAQTFTISGKIIGVESGKLIAFTQIDGKLDTLGRGKFSDGKFTFEGKTSEAVFAVFALEGYSGGFQFFAEPGATYDAHLVNGQGAYIRGGSMQNDWLKYTSYVEAHNLRLKAYGKQIDSLTQARKFKSVNDLNKEIEAAKAEVKAKLKALRDLHKDEEFTAYIALAESERQDQVEFKKSVLSTLSLKAQKTPSGRALVRQVAILEGAKVGKAAYAFSLPDVNGKETSLNSIKGKIKILDFWASWCGPCRLNNPELVRLYAEFKDQGLEVIGISLDDKKANWEAAIKKDGLPWIHLSALKGWKCEVAQNYGVTAVPAVFVLNENNQIIATDLRGDVLKEFIAKKLKLNNH